MQAALDAKTDTPAEKLVLLVIANYADDDGNNIYPSKQTLADKTGLDTRTVQRICAKLLEQGVLAVVSQSVGRPTVYRLHMDQMPALEKYRRAAGRPNKPPAPVQKTPGLSAENPRPDTGQSVIETSLEPSSLISEAREVETEPTQPAAEIERVPEIQGTVPVVPSWAADWPTLHIKDGDYTVQEPYASSPEIREGVIEWITRRMQDKKKGMPTVFAMKRTNCGWWDKYPMRAVVHALQKSAAEGWQGIIEDVARNWKPLPGEAQSVPTVQHNVQTMTQKMEARQAMIRAAQEKATTASMGALALEQSNGN